LLAEIKHVRQVSNEGFRRWFTDEYFDLIVWYTGAEVTGFQLCYDKGERERALTWRRPGRYEHHKVDDGEAPPGMYKMTPVLVQDGVFDHLAIAEKFQRASRRIDPEVARLVLDALRAYPA
jgi:hypothetical protein